MRKKENPINALGIMPKTSGRDVDDVSMSASEGMRKGSMCGYTSASGEGGTTGKKEGVGSYQGGGGGG